MPSFSGLVSSDQLDRQAAASHQLNGTVAKRAYLSVPTKRRMTHWSALKGPLTEGFRKQREKEAIRAESQPAARLPRAAKALKSANVMEAFTPNHLTMVEPFSEAAPLADPAFDLDSNDTGPGASLDIYTSNATRSVDTATYTRLALGDQATAVTPAGFQNCDWDRPTITYAMNLQKNIPLHGRDEVHNLDSCYSQPAPHFHSNPGMTPSISRPASTDWSALHSVEPVDDVRLHDCEIFSPKSYAPPHGRKCSDKDARRSRESASPKRHQRTESSSRTGGDLKPRGSRPKGLKRKAGAAFQEYNTGSARKGGRPPTDIDGFAHEDSEDQEEYQWSTIQYLKKQKKTTVIKSEPDIDATNLPAVYTNFQPQFRPKVVKNREIVNTSKFKLPIPAFEGRNDVSKDHQTPIIQSGSFAKDKKRPLFKPSFASQRPIFTTQGSGAIEISVHEQKKKQKAEVLKGLTSDTLGLVQRSTSDNREERAPSAESWQYKGSLYRSTKLGNGMEATSSLPFVGLHQVQHDEQDWTSSPGSSPVHEAGRSKTFVETVESTPAAASRTTHLQSPLPIKWTFKLFGQA